MNAESLKAIQGPIKERYREDPAAALQTLQATGRVPAEGIQCLVETPAGTINAGLHKATGGDGTAACSGDMLLQALVACAGVTLKAVATAMGLQVRSATVSAEADWDARGTLGVDKSAPVGFKAIRLRYEIDSDASATQLETLAKLTDRYCVIAQTLSQPPLISSTIISKI